MATGAGDWNAKLQDWTKRVARLGGREGMGELADRIEEASLELIDEQHEKGIGATGVPLEKKKNPDGKKPLTRTGKMRRSWFTKRTGLDTRIDNATDYAFLHNQGRRGPWTIRPKKKGGRLAFAGKDGGMVYARSVTHPGYPMRRMTPHNRKLPARWARRYNAEASGQFNRIMGRKLMGSK